MPQSLEEKKYRARIHKREWYDRNKETARARSRAWRLANVDKKREQDRRSKGLPTPSRPCPAACECCGKVQTYKALALDHCHERAVFRGWLCSDCNNAIGLLGDNREGVMLAITYLEKYGN